MRVALVHDWLTGMRGGEKVLDAICELFPEAPLYTFLHVPGSVSPRIEARRIITSPVQRLPSPERLYRHYLPLYPVAVELFDLDRYDLVISSSHCAVKSVVVRGPAVHICYCHSPMRYAWDQFHAYFGPDQVGAAKSFLLRQVMRSLASWDAATAGRVDRFLANSQYVAGRIRRYYNRGSTIVYPPVDTDFFSPSGHPTSPNCLIVSALVPYKRLDIAIESCRHVGVPLTIVGTGPELSRLQALADETVQFLGWQSDEQIRQLFREARATLLPGVEDFGIVPVEAQACGCPVVALDAGGVRETVLDGVTGVLVGEGTSEAFAKGLTTALQTPFDRDAIRANALRFSRQRFLNDFRSAIEDAVRHPTERAGGTPPVSRGPDEDPAASGLAPRPQVDREPDEDPAPSVLSPRPQVDRDNDGDRAARGLAPRARVDREPDGDRATSGLAPRPQGDRDNDEDPAARVSPLQQGAVREKNQ